MFVEVIALLVFLAAVYVSSTIWQNGHLPPGPFPLPVLGNLLSIKQKMPYRDLANMANKYGKVFRFQLGSKRVIVINSYEAAREALVAKAKDFAGRPPHFIGTIFGRNLTDFAFQTFSQRWKTLHKMVVTAVRLNEDKANISSHIQELCETFRSHNAKPFCVRDNVFQSVGSCIASMIFGQECKLDDSEVATLVEAVNAFRMSIAAADIIDTFPIFKYFPFETIRNAIRAGENRDEIFERKFQEHVTTFQRGKIRSVIDSMLKEFNENNSGLVTEVNLISR